MPVDIQKLIEKVTSGKCTRKQIENLRENAINKDGADELIEVCEDALSYGGGNNKPDTREIGFQETLKEIKRRGALQIDVQKQGNVRIINFISANGKQYSVVTRSKNKGDWQTTSDYGIKTNIDQLESKYWIFVDISFSPLKFYPVPQCWIQNDIYEKYNAYLKKHGGHRAVNDNSKHYAVRLEHINKWEGKWNLLDL
jgi:hypothetical protein